MKLTIIVDEPLNGDHFTPLEDVRGHVELGACNCEKITSIRINFEGKIKMSFMPRNGSETHSQFPEPRLLRESHPLFKQTKLVLPGDDVFAAGKKEEHGPCSVPFYFTFPSNSSCCGKGIGRARSLPPTLDIHSAGLKSKAAYVISVNVRRRGFLQRKLRAQRELKYRSVALVPSIQNCMEPSCVRHPTLISSSAMLPASRLGGPDPDLVLDGVVPGCVPAYSPALTLEVLMPYPAILSRGGKATLQIIVHSSNDFSSVVGGVNLRSITARLRGTTTSRIGSSTRTDMVYQPIWHTTGKVPIEREKFEVGCGVWQDCSLPGAVPLSFQSCTVSQTYAVEVLLGVSSQLRPQIEYISASIDVVIADPPPSYENEESVRE